MDLPPEPQLRWIVRRAASLLRLGAEPVRGLVLPTASFFPDRFDGSPESVAGLLARVQEHAGLSDLPVELSIVTPEGEREAVGGCSSGACSTVGPAPKAASGAGGEPMEARIDRVAQRQDGTYAVAIGAGEIRNPTVLTTALVRAVSSMFMSEAGAYDDLLPGEREAATDLASVLLGFGTLTANGSYVYTKGCGGVTVHSVTRMPVEEVGVALAIFCKLHDVPERLAAKVLELTPREAFDEGTVWASSNAGVIRLLRSNPTLVEDDDFALSPARSWLARALGLGKKRATDRPTEDDLAELERSLPKVASRRTVDGAKAARLAELRALVDESLEG